MPDLELLLDARATLAESLLWDPEDGVLYWADIRAPALFRLNPATLEQRRWDLPADIGAFALAEDRKTVVAALRTGLFALSRATGSLELLADPPFDPARFRFNEGACDVNGRFWVGAMFDPLPGEDAPAEPGPLVSWCPALGLQPQPDAAKCHNGMGWSPDGRTFYLSHSQDRVIYAFPFDAQRSEVGERRVFARTNGKGVPDGAAVDEEGAYWCAMHGAGCLHRYAPDGTLLEEIKLPVSKPTMCAFGGEDMRTLFVSSASEQLSAEQLADEPHAGGLFKFEPGVRGAPKPYLVR